MFFTKKISQIFILLGLAYGLLTLADMTLAFMPAFKTSADDSTKPLTAIQPNHDQ